MKPLNDTKLKFGFSVTWLNRKEKVNIACYWIIPEIPVLWKSKNILVLARQIDENLQ